MFVLFSTQQAEAGRCRLSTPSGWNERMMASVARRTFIDIPPLLGQKRPASDAAPQTSEYGPRRPPRAHAWSSPSVRRYAKVKGWQASREGAVGRRLVGRRVIKTDAGPGRSHRTGQWFGPRRTGSRSPSAVAVDDAVRRRPVRLYGRRNRSGLCSDIRFKNVDFPAIICYPAHYMMGRSLR